MAAGLAEIMRANPGVEPHAPTGRSGAGMVPGTALRTVSAGGFLPSLLLHPSFIPFQYIFRVMPNEGLYQASRKRLCTFEAGAFTVPRSQVLCVAEYRFQPYRLSGIAGDAIPLENGRLPLTLGYDINFSQSHKGNLRAEILPRQPSAAQSAFDGNRTLGGLGASDVLQQVLQSVYNSNPVTVPSALSTSFLQNSTAGDAMLPQSTKSVQGPERFPFSFVVEESQAVQLRITAFGPCPIPISFFETTLAGYLMPRSSYDELIKGIRP